MNAKQLTALNRIGELMFPANGEFPGFAELGCIQHIDLLVENAPKDDIALLKMVFGVLYYKPQFVYRFILWLMRTANSWPEPFASLFRTMDMGLRGMIVSLYYSGLKGQDFKGKTPLELIGYEVNVLRP